MSGSSPALSSQQLQDKHSHPKQMGSYHFGAGCQCKDSTISNHAVINWYADSKAESVLIIISFPRAVTQHIQYSCAGKDISPAQLYTVSAGNISN